MKERMMKTAATLTTLLALSVSSLALAQTGASNSGMMPGMPMQKCVDMQGMDMKGMSAQDCKDMMQNMNDKHAAKTTQNANHQATGIVKAIDPAKGTVTLAHEPVASLRWPAMTMRFTVKDKALFDKLVVDKKVDFEFKQQGKDYVLTAVQ